MVNHKYEKVKDKIYLVSTNAPQRRISFRKPEGAHARIYSSSVLRSVHAVLSLLFLLFFSRRVAESVYLYAHAGPFSCA